MKFRRKKKTPVPARRISPAQIWHGCIVAGVAVLLLINFFVGDNAGRLTYRYRVGQVSQHNVYAPADFSFYADSGEHIEIKKNELILQRGERVTQLQEQALRHIETGQQPSRRLYYLLGGVLLLILFVIVGLAFFGTCIKLVQLDLKTNLLSGILLTAIVFGGRGIMLAEWPIFIIPVASVAMLLTILVHPLLGISVSGLSSVLLGLMSGSRFDLPLAFFFGSIVAVYGVRAVRNRSGLTRAGIIAGSVQFITIVSVGLLEYQPLPQLIRFGAWGLANGVFSMIITVGILPALEYLFGITTDITLLELSDLNQPALKTMALNAPGTYHHCLVVGNLAEAAAETVGANSLLARVGAYYHDIGKTRMANYFSENQAHTENRHDALTPTISSLLIINHVKEGRELAQDYRLGPVIQDIISQHHGNDLVHFFYHRALAKDEQGQVKADDFRYPGPKPQFKEAAIVMLADAVEAASRSLPQPTPVKINEMVGRIINNKFIDGQLDECDLTLRDLHGIAETLSRVLSGIYHSRVAYPAEELLRAQSHTDSQSAEISAA